MCVECGLGVRWLDLWVSVSWWLHTCILMYTYIGLQACVRWVWLVDYGCS
uniref:Uncharacterized protein n=1 Tax=Arundo donax TaxID=35708 RepID=A0A0A9BT04_ARUDO